MGLTLSNTYREAACNAGVDLLDVGSTNANGRLVIRTAADAVLVTINLSNPAFGAASGTGVATAAGLPLSATASATGVAAHYIAQDRDEVEIWRGTVTATGGGGDLELSSTSVTSGQPVNITAWTHTVPAS